MVRSSISGAVSILLLLSFLAAGMVPAGFMPSTQKDGYFLTICSGNGTKQVFVNGEQPGHNDQQSHEKACSFALAANFILPSPEYLVVAQAIAQAITVRNHSTNNPDQIVVKNYHSQGPPAFFVV